MLFFSPLLVADLRQAPPRIAIFASHFRWLLMLLPDFLRRRRHISSPPPPLTPPPGFFFFLFRF